MSSRITPVAFALTLALIAFGAPAPRAALGEADTKPMHVGLGHGSTLWLEGTSSMHDFVSRTSDIGLKLGRTPSIKEPLDGQALDALIRATGVRSLVVTVPIAPMRSGKTALDKNMRKALKAEQFPVITFALAQYKIVARSVARDTAEIEATGTLNVAGQTRPASLNARAWREGGGLWLVGTQPLKMSDFGIKPPKMMLGTLKVHDPIVVHYRLLLTPATETVSQSNSVK
jgi:hypothetical protein